MAAEGLKFDEKVKSDRLKFDAELEAERLKFSKPGDAARDLQPYIKRFDDLQQRWIRREGRGEELTASDCAGDLEQLLKEVRAIAVSHKIPVGPLFPPPLDLANPPRSNK